MSAEVMGTASQGATDAARRRSATVEGVVRILLLVGICTSSIEILLTLNLGGFNTRLIYFFVLFASLGMAYLAVRRGRVVIPYASAWIGAWIALNVLYLPNAGILVRGLLFVAVLLASLLMVFGVAQVFRTERQVHQLLKWYLFAFVAHALLGLGQLFLYKVFGINTVSQSNFDTPRMNGLTHEPSSFAAYEVMGYILARELLRRRSFFLNRRMLQRSFAVIALALILSTSKTALLFVFAYEAVFALIVLGGAVRRGRFDKKALATLAMSLGAATMFIVYVATNLNTPEVQRMVSGSGIGGAPSHSFDDRFERSALTVVAASQHLLIGTSYGGAGVYLTQLIQGASPGGGTNEDVISPLFTPAEIVLATGLPGLFIVMVYFALLMWKSARVPDLEMRKVCATLAWSYMFGLAATGSDFTRAILWSHIAVWSGVLTVALRGLPAPETVSTHAYPAGPHAAPGSA